jgi:LPS export ABC transporter protein LptC
MGRRGSAIRLLFGAAGAVLGLSAAACPSSKRRASGPPARAARSPLPDSADQILFGFKALVTDKGVANGELLADTALVFDDGTRLELRRVNVTFFTKLGAHDGVMTSRAGTYNVRLSRIEARGDVIVTRDDGKRLTSPMLVYDQVRNQFFTDSTFVFSEPKRTLTGIGFESDPRLANFRCLRNCKGTAPVKVPTR